VTRVNAELERSRKSLQHVSPNQMRLRPLFLLLALENAVGKAATGAPKHLKRDYLRHYKRYRVVVLTS